MKKLLSILLISVFLFTGCVTNKRVCVPCPHTDILTKVSMGGRVFIIAIPKGAFDDPKNYRTIEQYKEELRKKQGL